MIAVGSRSKKFKEYICCNYQIQMLRQSFLYMPKDVAKIEAWRMIGFACITGIIALLEGITISD